MRKNIPKKLVLLTRAFFATVAFFKVFTAIFVFLAAIHKRQQRTIKIQFGCRIKCKVVLHIVNVKKLCFHNNTSNMVLNIPIKKTVIFTTLI